MNLDKSETAFSFIDEKDENFGGDNCGNEYEESEVSKVSEGEEDDIAQEIGRDKIGR